MGNETFYGDGLSLIFHILGAFVIKQLLQLCISFALVGYEIGYSQLIFNMLSWDNKLLLNISRFSKVCMLKRFEGS